MYPGIENIDVQIERSTSFHQQNKYWVTPLDHNCVVPHFDSEHDKKNLFLLLLMIIFIIQEIYLMFMLIMIILIIIQVMLLMIRMNVMKFLVGVKSKKMLPLMKENYEEEREKG